MENKEMKKPIPMELSEEDLNLIAGGYQDFTMMDDLTEPPGAMQEFLSDQPLFTVAPPVEIGR